MEIKRRETKKYQVGDCALTRNDYFASVNKVYVYIPYNIAAEQEQKYKEITY